jgi:amidase
MISNPDSSVAWQSVAAKTQSTILNSIPVKWKLPANIPRSGQTRVLDVPETCGILTPKQLEITSLTASELVLKLRTAELSAVNVAEAFCARAAIAHQLVNCLTDYFPEEALERAQDLDRILAGKMLIFVPHSEYLVTAFIQWSYKIWRPVPRET